MNYAVLELMIYIARICMLGNRNFSKKYVVVMLKMMHRSAVGVLVELG